MDVQQLRCFVAVADELHFGRAAERLHLTPSPVSRAVKDLERQLGVTLFERGYHRVALTPAGEQLIGGARELIESFDTFESLARRMPGDRIQPLRLGGTYLAPPDVLDRLVELAEHAMMSSSIDVVLAPSSELLPALATSDLHMALVHLPVDDDVLDSQLVARYDFYIAMRSDDPLASREHLQLADITGRALTLTPKSSHPVAVNRLYEQLVAQGLSKFHQLPDYDSARLAHHVRRTHGLTLTLHPSAGGGARVFDDAAFAVLPLVHANLNLELGVAWRRDTAESDPVRALVAAIRAEWAEHVLTV